MLLEITTTHQPATDLGYLLHKHPDKNQRFELNFGAAHVFYPEATTERCTAALLLDIDPLKLTQRGVGVSDFALQSYVNDRPYVASSFLSVAIADVYRSALNGQCKSHPDLAVTPIPLQARLAMLPCRGGEAFLRRLFEPLGYQIEVARHPLDPAFTDWGDSNYYTVVLKHTLPLAQLLVHLYVLVPVLDDQKHYWVSDDEVQKLLARGGEWLTTHPAQEQIVRRYLRHQRKLTKTALAQLNEDVADPDAVEAVHNAEEESGEKQIGLHQQRLQAVVSVLTEAGATSVMDLGCGEGKLLRQLLRHKRFERILGMDISPRRLEIAAERLRLETLPERQRARIQLIHGSLIYRDARLSGYDAAAVVEVIEHLDPFRLASFERVLFEFAQPSLVALTTPNREYNVMWPSLPVGAMRHRDHRFEWTRAEFAAWAQRVAAAYGYTVTIAPIGPEVEGIGAPSQMGVFRR